VPNITLTRRVNVVALYQAFLHEKILAGEAPKGLDQAFAAVVEISPSMWSQIKSSRPISDKLARQIEHHTNQEAGWLDVRHTADAPPDEAEERFVELARTAWRAANARDKRALAKSMKDAAQSRAA